MKKVVTSTMIGNGLEWYDYALYGHFAALISKQFFPSTDPVANLVLTFGIFAAGFLMRPLGGIFFGYIGDKYGRKKALSLSILLMAIPTACIGLLPTYETIGIMAPILLTIIRLIQGIAIGGEFGGSIIYLVEHAPENRKNLVGSASMISALIGILAGAATSSWLASVMSVDDFETWGWRIPFILGLFIGLIGLYIRTHLSESPAFMDAQETGHLSDQPVKDTFRYNMKEILLAIGVYFAVTIPFYLQVVFMNSLMVKFLGFTLGDALFINTFGLISMMVAAVIAAHLADRGNRIKVLKVILLSYFVLAIPVVYLLEQSIFNYALAAQIMFGLIVGAYIAPIPAMLVDIFPTKTRYTGMSVACNVGAAIFGGTTPMVMAYFIGHTGNYYFISFAIILSAIVSFICLSLLQKKGAVK